MHDQILLISPQPDSPPASLSFGGIRFCSFPPLWPIIPKLSPVTSHPSPTFPYWPLLLSKALTVPANTSPITNAGAWMRGALAVSPGSLPATSCPQISTEGDNRSCREGTFLPRRLCRGCRTLAGGSGLGHPSQLPSAALDKPFLALVSFLRGKGVFIVPDMRLGAALVPLPIVEIPHLTYIQMYILMPATHLRKSINTRAPDANDGKFGSRKATTVGFIKALLSFFEARRSRENTTEPKNLNFI